MPSFPPLAEEGEAQLENEVIVCQGLPRARFLTLAPSEHHPRSDAVPFELDHIGIISAMSAQPPPKSFASLLWDIIRLGVRALWENRANPARTLLERQQALALLGLPPNATRQQIKRRYRSLAKRYHPDRGGDQQQMRRIIAAYEYLTREQPTM